jgi:hypothetical protein
MGDYPTARVESINGQLVLIDPTAEGVIAAVENHNEKIRRQNCRGLFEANLDRVRHFKNRVSHLGLTADAVVIVVLNVDDPYGGSLAEVLMPGHDWQQYRDRGEMPCARGLAERSGIQDALDVFDELAAARLKREKGLAVVVIDSGVAEIFSINE